MKSSSDLIAQNVYSVNAFYTRKQNETKELFFKCLKEKKSLEYFDKELSKIWDNVDHKFMDKQILKLQKLVHSNNVEEFLNLNRFSQKKEDAIYEEISDWVVSDEFFKLTPEEVFNQFEQKFKANVLKNYKLSQEGITKDGEEFFLRNKLNDYNEQVNQTITYFKEEKEIINGKEVIKLLSHNKKF